MILCVNCTNCKDYGNGWVFCPATGKWLHKGYTKCKSFNEGNPQRVQHPGTWSWIDRVTESQESKDLRRPEK